MIVGYEPARAGLIDLSTTRYIQSNYYIVGDIRRIDIMNVSFRNYKKIRQGKFPIKIECQDYSIDFKTLKPEKLHISERGCYDDLYFPNNLDYLVYTKRDYESHKCKIWILPLKQSG